MQDTCKIHRIRILITNPTKFDNKPHVSLVWVAEVTRWAAGVIGDLLALERALRMRSERCEQHVKVGVQDSGFAWLVV